MSARDFAVWAPEARSVVVVIAGNGTHPLSPVPAGPAEGAQTGGWWRLAEPVPLPAGPVDYGFVVDGEGPFPDPRSLRQPNGVLAVGEAPLRFGYS